MDIESLLKRLEDEIGNIDLPKKIIRSDIAMDINNSVYDDIENDYGSLIRDEVDYNTCSMIICDLELLSDETVLYFLPRLLKAIVYEGGNEFLLYRRLEKLNFSNHFRGAKIVKEVILLLKKIEKLEGS